MAALSTLTVSTFYMIAQMVGAGALVKLLLGGYVTYNRAVIGVGILMIVYVVFGGMLATTWVQIVKAMLLMAGTILLSILVLAHFHFSLGEFFEAVSHVTYHDAKGGEVVKDFLQPGLRYKPPYGPLDLISLGLALIFGTAGLPHILVRFYTVPDAKTARHSVVWAMVLIGSFYIMTTFLGFGAATIVGPDFIKTHGGTNMSAPLLAQALAGNVFFAFISAIAFATILAVVAGLTISATTSFSHDFWTNVIHHGVERKPGEEVLVARISAFVVGGGGDCDRDRAGTDSERGVPGGAGVCGGGVGESAGDCDVDFLAAIQYRGRGDGAGGRIAGFDRVDSGQPEPDGDRSADGDGNGAALDPGEGVVPAGESGHCEYSAGIPGRDYWDSAQSRAGFAGEVQRADGSFEYRAGRGEGYGVKRKWQWPVLIRNC